MGFETQALCILEGLSRDIRSTQAVTSNMETKLHP